VVLTLILEKASSMGWKSGEYGGRYSTQTPKWESVSYQLRTSRLTELFTKLCDISTMVDLCIVHH
jgi:hypothetical protein